MLINHTQRPWLKFFRRTSKVQSVWKSLKKSHFETVRAKRASFTFKWKIFENIFVSFVASTHKYSLSIIVFCIQLNASIIFLTFSNTMTLCTQFMIFSVFATKKLRSADNAAPARISRTRQFSFVTLVYEELSRFPQWSLLVLLVVSRISMQYCCVVTTLSVEQRTTKAR